MGRIRRSISNSIEFSPKKYRTGGKHMKAISKTRLRKYAKLSLALATFVLFWFTLGPARIIKRGVPVTAAKSDTRGVQSGIPYQESRRSATANLPAQTRLLKHYGQLPLSFETNRGQTDARVKFLSRGRGYKLFLTSNEVILGLAKPRVRNRKLEARRELPVISGQSQKTADSFPALLAPPLNGPYFGPASRTGLVTDNGQRTTDAVLRMKLVGMNPAPRVTPLAQLPGKSNYLIGNDPKKWRINVPTYAKVKY